MINLEQLGTCSVPIFDVTRGSYRKLGLIPLAEMAARRMGDAVLLHLPAEHDVVLLSGAYGANHFAHHVESQPAERGDVTSNSVAVQQLLGDSKLAQSWRNGRLPIDAHLPNWLGRARADATRALLRNALKQNGTDSLRTLCRLWSVRACCPALIGHAVADSDLVAGFLQIERYFKTLSIIEAHADVAEKERSFKQARAFVDDALSAALSSGDAEDNAIALLRPLLDSARSEKEKIAELRPVIFGLLFEVLQIDGLNLLWALTELARNDDLTTQIAAQDSDGLLARATAMETLRLYPELPFIQKTESFPGTKTAEAAAVLYAPWLVHRDARLWTEPARFQPERFLSDAGATNLPDIYMPFGLGPTARQRTEFVISQLAETLVTICKAARFSLTPSCPPGHLRPVYQATLQPRGEIDVCWQPRFSNGQAAFTFGKEKNYV